MDQNNQRDMSGIWAIVLAAGESRRMGSPKMLLPFKGSSMIERVIMNISGSEVNSIIVVVGALKEPLEELLDKLSVKHCYNDKYMEGMLSSVKCGFRNLPLDVEAVLVFQGDQPLISSSIINRVIEAFRSSDKGILMPVYKGRRGHPLLIDKKYISEIEKLDAGEGLRSLAYRFSDNVLEVETDDPDILRDFDTLEEYKVEVN